ncbi:MAG: hypothetical protein ACJA1B_001149 [Polaribacter sp.]|jgi:hypothetical protein
MSTETLKIAFAQKILAISDTKLLKKIKSLIEHESVIGYEVNNTPISVNNYVQEMDLSIKAIENKTATLYTTEEVRKRIIDANNLG